MVEKLIIASEVFVDFIIKSTIGGDIPQVLLKQTDNGYVISDMAENVISCVGILNKSVFTQFGKVGNITIKDVKKFVAMIKDVKEPLTIERVENKVIISSGKIEFEYVLCSEEFIETTLKDEILISFDDGFKLTKAFLDGICSKVALLGVNAVKLECKNKVLRAIIEEGDKFVVKEEIAYKDCVASYGGWLFKLSKLLPETFQVSFDTEYPIRIIVKNVNYELKYYIAPFANMTEEEAKKEDKEEKDG